MALTYGAAARMRLHAGDEQGARRELAAWTAALDAVPRVTFNPVALPRIYPYTWIDEALPALADEAQAQAAYDELCAWTSVRFVPWSARGFDHTRGALALRLGRIDEAEAHYRSGLVWAERERCPVEQGRCLHGLAEVVVRRGDRTEAVKLFGRAAALFRQHEARLYLRQLEARVQAIQAQPAPASPPAATPEPGATGVPLFSAERRLVTVLFTDIVGSTERAVALGDRAWRRLKAQHHEAVRRELARFRGREVDTAGDGFFAIFDGPARAVRCACAIRDAVRELGLEVRAGLHLGEVEEQQDGTVSGLTVHVGARVAGLAGPSEVLVTHTVKDLVAGSGLRFVDRGRHALKGVPGEWALFAVEDERDPVEA